MLSFLHSKKIRVRYLKHDFQWGWNIKYLFCWPQVKQKINFTRTSHFHHSLSISVHLHLYMETMITQNWFLFYQKSVVVGHRCELFRYKVQTRLLSLKVNLSISYYPVHLELLKLFRRRHSVILYQRHIREFSLDRISLREMSVLDSRKLKGKPHFDGATVFA